MKNKRKVVKLYFMFTIAAEILSLPFLGFNPGFAGGLLAGAAAFTVNLALLERVVYGLTAGKNKITAFLIQLGRFLVFGAAGILCAFFGVNAVIALGVSAVTFTAGIVTAALKGGNPA